MCTTSDRGVISDLVFISWCALSKICLCPDVLSVILWPYLCELRELGRFWNFLKAAVYVHNEAKRCGGIYNHFFTSLKYRQNYFGDFRKMGKTHEPYIPIWHYISKFGSLRFLFWIVFLLFYRLRPPPPVTRLENTRAWHTCKVVRFGVFRWKKARRCAWSRKG